MLLTKYLKIFEPQNKIVTKSILRLKEKYEDVYFKTFELYDTNMELTWIEKALNFKQKSLKT